MSLQLHLHPPIMTRGQGTQEEPDEFPYLNVEFLYLIKRAATPSFHSNLPRNKEREEHILRLLLLKTTTCPSRTLLDPTCRYYFAYYSSSGCEPLVTLTQATSSTSWRLRLSRRHLPSSVKTDPSFIASLHHFNRLRRYLTQIDLHLTSFHICNKPLPRTYLVTNWKHGHLHQGRHGPDEAQSRRCNPSPPDRDSSASHQRHQTAAYPSSDG